MGSGKSARNKSTGERDGWNFIKKVSSKKKKTLPKSHLIKKEK